MWSRPSTFKKYRTTPNKNNIFGLYHFKTCISIFPCHFRWCRTIVILFQLLCLLDLFIACEDKFIVPALYWIVYMMYRTLTAAAQT